jgi:hypothetical protein
VNEAVLIVAFEPASCPLRRGRMLWILRLRRRSKALELEGRLRSTKPLVVFVVGHERWGKSWTFRALCRDFGSRRVNIDGTVFRVRRTSNDDITKRRPDSYKDFIRSLSPALKPHVMAALCPKFRGISNCDNPKKYAGVYLKVLQKQGYRLFFWVLEYRWRKPRQLPATISIKEISVLRRYAKRTRGRVRVFSEKNAKASKRARELRRFAAGILQ